MTIAEQDGEFNAYATFVDHAGKAAVLSGIPTISILHRQGVQNKTDINNQNMILLSGTSYSFTWRPTSRAYKGTYTAKYMAVYSGATAVTNVIGSESFNVANKKFFEKGAGTFVSRTVAAKTVWSQEEKDAVFKALDALDSQISNDEKRDTIKELEASIGRIVDEQHRKVTEVSNAIIKLQKKATEAPGFDDSKIIAKLQSVFDEVGSLKRKVGEFGEISKDLRLPQIIAELEDLKVDGENFRQDLVKLLSTTSLVKGVGLSEKVK